MATLPTNFKDDILDTSVNTRRRYRMYENTNGTIELEDVTEYSQVGDEFGAGQINSTNTEVNKKFDKNMLVRDLDTINAITEEGYAPDALALKEVNNSLNTLGSLFFRKSFNCPNTTGVTVESTKGASGTVDISQSGYKPISVTLANVSNGRISASCYLQPDNKNAFYSMVNPSATTVTAYCSIQVTYVRDNNY